MNALIINSTDNLSSIKLFYLSRRIGNLSSLMTYFSKFFIVSPFNGPYKNHRIKLFKLSKTSIEWNNDVHGLVFFVFPSKQRDNLLKSYLSFACSDLRFCHEPRWRQTWGLDKWNARSWLYRHSSPHCPCCPKKYHI